MSLLVLHPSRTPPPPLSQSFMTPPFTSSFEGSECTTLLLSENPQRIPPQNCPDSAGTALPAEKLLSIAHDLDRPPDKQADAEGGTSKKLGASKDDEAGSSAGESSSSRAGDDSGAVRSPSKGSKSGTKRGRGDEQGGGEDGGTSGSGEGASSGPAKLGRSASTSFARAPVSKRPTISLDLDDLDSDSSEEEDDADDDSN